MLNFRGGGLTVERLMYFTDWAPGVHFVEKKALFQFLLRNPRNEKGKSITYLAHRRQRLREPVLLSLAQHTATPFASLPPIWGSEDALWGWRGLCRVLTHQHSVPAEGQILRGVTWGLRGVLVIALGVRRGERGPGRCMSYESPRSKVACRCPPL